ncbi:SDR family NAD(P)-dependent oxidoreductase [Aquabacterium sp. OR-4]|uniref:SDR family NAD(P)-dependent oxidoreductase n=1 Tax=Aquabacterium sp. OR-4 TaxID=2978127 RepID=UPI0021B17FC0|nr:SDR family oxidoreductase [Aquabacterium sp. OR-4]MDT7833609.1 SDR family oxidoreductase [Aquabacterium sp. OR-4]
MRQDHPGRGLTALITGASSGIGAALAARFARGGFNLVLVARRAEPLQALAQALVAEHGIRAWAEPADLAQPEAPAALAARLRRARRRIDVLVNNAGLLEHGPFIDHPAHAHRALIGLNVAGLTEMLAQFVPPMVQRGQGRVLNVASIAAFQPVPQLAVYAATKAYVLSITESMSEELKASGVSFTALCPGITATSMLEQAQQASEALQSRLPDFVVGSADAVADEGYEACLAGEVIRVPGTLNLAAILAGRAAPKWLLRRVSGAVMRRMT